MQNKAPTTKERLALVRYEVICHVKTLRQEDMPLAEALRSASSRPWPGEDGHYYSYRTIETWWYAHAKSGYQGLCGKPVRADAGKSRAIDEETGLWIIDKIRQNPATPLQVLYRHWQAHGHGLSSLSAIYRFLKTHGYDRRSLKAGRLESGPTKAFEAPAPNDLWMVDFACGPTLRTPEGRSITTQLCVIIDDHSRLIPFAAYYLSGDTASFLDCLRQAVLRRGLPIKLYTDQGKPFVNTHVRIVCANLGIRLLHAKPYHAWSKGKVERLIRTIQGDFEATLKLEGEHVHSLADLNTAFSRWIAGLYHLRVHGSTTMSPHERFTRAGHPLRTIEEPEKINTLFYTRTERVVRKDGTVTLGKKLLEVNLALRALTVELRYDPVLFDRVEVWHKGSFHGIARLANLQLNSTIAHQHRGTNYAR
jgi:transposase InsO family protein